MSHKRFDDRVWDRFFDFLYVCDESVDDATVDADLQRAGIDVRPAFRRLQGLIEERRARAQLSEARGMRAAVFDRIRDVVAPKMDDLRTGIKALIANRFSGTEQAAYFHKLEGAATEADLQSLLDDMEKLAALRQARRDVNESGK